MAARRPIAALPASFDAQLATLVKTAPDGDDWLHEIKFDGYRIAARLDHGKVKLLSRRGNDWSSTFPEVRDAVARLPVRQALLDGEVAAVLPDGRTSFQALQRAGEMRERPVLTYFVFDLLPLPALRLRPAAVPSRLVGVVAALGDDPLEPTLAGGREEAPAAAPDV